MALCDWASDGKGRITQRNKYISISQFHVSKVLFFIYLRIDSPENAGWVDHRAGPTVWPASGVTALALGVLQNKTDII